MRLPERLVEGYKRVRDPIVDWWTAKPEDEREAWLGKAQYGLNCLTTAVLLSFPVSGLFYLLFSFWSLQSHFTVFFCVLVSVPVLEHYYVWFREEWKDGKYQ